MEESLSKEMYKEHILELGKNPKNFGKLKNPTHEFKIINENCGDEIEVQLEVEKGVIKDVKFTGKGCIINMASASLLADKIKGMKVEQVKKLSWEDIKKLLNIEVNPARIKCAMISLSALKKAIGEKDVKN